jgi:hypothetical protein
MTEAAAHVVGSWGHMFAVRCLRDHSRGATGMSGTYHLFQTALAAVSTAM